MPLLDHFHPPLSQRRRSEGLQNALASAIADQLNLNVLPEPYVAEFQVHATARVEVDVATFEEFSAPRKGENKNGGGTATMTMAVWSPPESAAQMPIVFPDHLEINVFSLEGGRKLVSAIEIVSPSNKDRPESRLNFAIKCANYLLQGVGLVIVDLVTVCRSNLHNELIDLLETGASFKIPAKANLYIVAYRPVRTKEIERIDIWPTRLSLGDTLPVVPLALGTGPCVPLDLEAAYTDMCRRLRLG